MDIKQTAILILSVLACGTAAVNLAFSGNANQGNVFEIYNDSEEYVASGEKDSYFENARYTRKQSRDEAISVLKGIMNDDNADSGSVSEAASEIKGYARRADSETQIENRILAKGFPECIVFVSRETCSIVVKTDGLSRDQAAQIMEIAVSETGYSSNTIKIIELK